MIFKLIMTTFAKHQKLCLQQFSYNFLIVQIFMGHIFIEPSSANTKTLNPIYLFHDQ